MYFPQKNIKAWLRSCHNDLLNNSTASCEPATTEQTDLKWFSTRKQKNAINCSKAADQQYQLDGSICHREQVNPQK